MQVKLLKGVVVDIAGQGAEPIVDVLYNKKNVNEFLIAKKLDLNINQARNILYRLGDHGLVSFIRKKDSKKGGWYTYFWTLDVHKSLQLLKSRLSKKINDIETNLSSRKKKRYYYSPEIDVEYTEEEALEHDFICPETGEVMELRDNSDLVAGLETDLGTLKEEFEAVNIEIEQVEKI